MIFRHLEDSRIATLNTMIIMKTKRHRLRVRLPRHNDPMRSLLRLTINRIRDRRNIIYISRNLRVIIIFRRKILRLLMVLNRKLTLIRNNTLIPRVLRTRRRIIRPPVRINITRRRDRPPTPNRTINLGVRLGLLLKILNARNNERHTRLRHFPRHLTNNKNNMLIRSLLRYAQVTTIIDGRRTQQNTRSTMLIRRNITMRTIQRLVPVNISPVRGLLILRLPNLNLLTVYAIFIRVRVLINITRRLPRNTTLRITNSNTTYHVTRKRLKILTKVLYHLHPSTTRRVLYTIPIRTMRSDSRLITTITTRRILKQRNRARLFNGKTSMLITLIITRNVISNTRIIRIGSTRHHIPIQQIKHIRRLFTLILIKRTNNLVRMSFTLRGTIRNHMPRYLRSLVARRGGRPRSIHRSSFFRGIRNHNPLLKMSLNRINNLITNLRRVLTLNSSNYLNMTTLASGSRLISRIIRFTKGDNRLNLGVHIIRPRGIRLTTTRTRTFSMKNRVTRRDVFQHTKGFRLSSRLNLTTRRTNMISSPNHALCLTRRRRSDRGRTSRSNYRGSNRGLSSVPRPKEVVLRSKGSVRDTKGRSFPCCCGMFRETLQI